MRRNNADLHVKVNKYGSILTVYDTVESKACEITLFEILIADLKQNQPELFHIDCYLIKNSKEKSV